MQMENWKKRDYLSESQIMSKIQGLDMELLTLLDFDLWFFIAIMPQFIFYRTKI